MCSKLAQDAKIPTCDHVYCAECVDMLRKCKVCKIEIEEDLLKSFRQIDEIIAVLSNAPIETKSVPIEVKTVPVPIEEKQEAVNWEMPAFDKAGS